jgi:hypothetical protein
VNERQKMLIGSISAAVILFAAAAATAHSWAASTPLYTFRMEQASSKMSFLPTTVNGFDYTTEKGYTLDCDTGSCYTINGVIFGTGYYTCPDDTCEHCLTYSPAVTCEDTCITCPPTSEDTCPPTCGDTCPPTCPETCPNTCQGYTCEDTLCYVTCCYNTYCIVR